MPSRSGAGVVSAGRSFLVTVSFCGKASCLAVKFAVLAVLCEGQNETTAGVSDDPTAPERAVECRHTPILSIK